MPRQRLMPGRRYSEGLHQALEAKELRSLGTQLEDGLKDHGEAPGFEDGVEEGRFGQHAGVSRCGSPATRSDARDHLLELP